ncbi:MAG: hypothetical protein HY716_14475 [Planctomycetes bacterium]|nr:hypothetical protein [Planctomycetota bacterium]
MTDSVLVVGGQGFFGRALVEDLLEHTEATIVVGSRRLRRSLNHPRLRWRIFDLVRPGFLEGYAAVVCCAGPYQGMPTTLVEAAAQASIPYIDLADARDFIVRARRIRSSAPMMIGLSAVPGITCLLAGRSEVGRIQAVRTFIAPGSRPPRGRSTLASLLSGIERWGAREIVQFPRPVGRRAVYRTIEVGDLDIVPELFEGASFEFKVGFDVDIFNRGLEALHWLRTRSLTPHPLRIQPFLEAVVRTLSFLGTGAGAVQVEVVGSKGRYVGSVVARERGYRIPSLLAAITVERILAGRLRETRLDRWLPNVHEELTARGVEFGKRTVIRTLGAGPTKRAQQPRGLRRPLASSARIG